jgi:hypothetical protein
MIVAFSGRKFAGKDTCAEGLIKRHNFIRVSLADELKDIASVVFHIPRTWMDDPDQKERRFKIPIIINSTHLEDLIDQLEMDGFRVSETAHKNIFAEFLGTPLQSIRHTLQLLGTDICRLNIKDTIWLEYFDRRVSKIDGNVVVTDARFKNERDHLKNLGAVLVLVQRENRSDATKLHATELHISENQLGVEEDYDVLVYNIGTECQLQSEISMWYTVKYATKNKNSQLY